MRIFAVLALILSAGAAMSYQGYLKSFDPLKNQSELGYYLEDNALDKVDANGFVLMPSGYREIYEVYGDYIESPQTPIFVSADLAFHTFHLMVDYAVRVMELQELLPRLEKLTMGMLELSEAEYKSAPGWLKDPAKAEYAYFAVAARLLGEDVEIKDKSLGKAVDAELAKIQAHSGFDDVAFLPGAKEDYSQYVPRGHYTRSAEFERYFKAMMWYGRLPFGIPAEGEPLLSLRAALYMAFELDGNEELATLWDEIYEPTAFFFGTAEDLTPGILASEAKKFFSGATEAEIIKNDAGLREFAKYLRTNYRPKIISQLILNIGGEENVEVPLSLRFMPQRFVPDSYVFTELVADRVRQYRGQTKVLPFTWGMTEQGPMRVFPRGLDAMAVAGWGTAARILKDGSDTDYDNYAEQFAKMKAWYAGLTEETRESSIYFRWFDLFASYKDAAAPHMVDSSAWEQKKLLTALGSWTELRHDAILYAKQSYAVGMAANGHYTPPQPLYKAVVEEAPGFYSRCAECARVIAGFPAEAEIKEAFTDFAGVLDKLAELSTKQAEESLSDEEHRWLWYVSGEMRSLARRLELKAVTTETDERMALVADVHTDVNSGQVLEEATGDPARLYVLAEIGGKLYVAQGAAYSYYEFKQPMSARLTDEAWQEMIDMEQTPAMPAWTEAIFAR